MKVYHFLILFGAAAVMSCSNRGHVPDEHTDWGYTGEVSPEHWAELSPENIKCIEGHLQSPIDILTFETDTFAGHIEFDYHPSHIDVANNGHTIQATLADSNFLRVDQHDYRMLQLHFHEPAEHHLDGIIYPMEVHFVHKDLKGNLAVVGLFVKEGPENPYLSMIWDDVPEHVNEHHEEAMDLLLSEIFPADRKIYHYVGSLTTPPCTEGVEWFVIERPISMSKSQIARFRSLYHGNNRPVQEGSEAHVEIVGG
jgi:carbonic anhydrase